MISGGSLGSLFTKDNFGVKSLHYKHISEFCCPPVISSAKIQARLTKERLCKIGDSFKTQKLK